MTRRIVITSEEVGAAPEPAAPASPTPAAIDPSAPAAAFAPARPGPAAAGQAAPALPAVADDDVEVTLGPSRAARQAPTVPSPAAALPPAAPANAEFAVPAPPAPTAAPGHVPAAQEAPTFARPGDAPSASAPPTGAVPAALADPGSRFLAALIDGTMAIVAVLVVYAVAMGIGVAAAGVGGLLAGYFLALVLGIPPVAYLMAATMAREGERNGQTFGMQLVGVRKVRLDGQPFRLGFSLAAYYLPGILFNLVVVGPLVNAAWVLFHPQRQSLRDLMFKTVAITAPKA